MSKMIVQASFPKEGQMMLEFKRLVMTGPAVTTHDHFSVDFRQPNWGELLNNTPIGRQASAFIGALSNVLVVDAVDLYPKYVVIHYQVGAHIATKVVEIIGRVFGSEIQVSWDQPDHVRKALVHGPRLGV